MRSSTDTALFVAYMGMMCPHAKGIRCELLPTTSERFAHPLV